MGDPTCALPTCGHPARRYAICQTHADRMIRHAAQLPARIRDLEITISKQARIGAGGNGQHTDRHPLPYDWRASRTSDEVRKTLAELVRAIHPRGLWPHPGLAVIGAWIHAHTAELLQWDNAAQACTDLAATAAAIDRVTDRPPLVLYAGRCGGRRATGRCDLALYAEPGAAFVICPMCRARTDVDQRRDHMRQQIDGMLLTLPEIVRFAGYFEHFDKRRAWRLLDSWRRRGTITPRTIQDREVYPFGDILNRLLGAERRTRRAAG